MSFLIGGFMRVSKYLLVFLSTAVVGFGGGELAIKGKQYREQRKIVAGDYVQLVSWSGLDVVQAESDGLLRFGDGACSFTVKKGNRTIVLEVPSNRVQPDENLEPHRLLAAMDAKDGALRYLFHDPWLAQRLRASAQRGTAIAQQHEGAPTAASPDSARSIPDGPFAP